MIDMSKSSRETHHQCDYVNLLGMPYHLQDAFFVFLDHMWQLGTKRWIGIEEKMRNRNTPLKPGEPPFFWEHERYAICG
jgi:hypothetical protein